MWIKMGTFVPTKGTIVHLCPEVVDFRGALAKALHLERGSTHRAIKTAMRWTRAGERTVKYWFAGERRPSGEHLILLARHSDMVFLMALLQAGRHEDEDRPGEFGMPVGVMGFVEVVAGSTPWDPLVDVETTPIAVAPQNATTTGGSMAVPAVMVEIVLVSGRMFRAPTTLPTSELRRLIGAVGGA